MIVVDGVTKRHRDIVSVDDVSFTAAAGMVTGLLGPNGAGKSSLMRIMCDLDRADRGSVTVAGRRYRDHPAPNQVNISIVPQQRAVRPIRTLSPLVGTMRRR